MKHILITILLAICSISFVSCDENKKIEGKKRQAIELAERAEQTHTDIAYGLKFGMSPYEADSVMRKNQNYDGKKLTIQLGKYKYKGTVITEFDEGELYKVTYYFRVSNQDLVKEISPEALRAVELLQQALPSDCENFSYTWDVDGSKYKRIYYYTWVHENLVVEAERTNNGFEEMSITYTNQPIVREIIYRKAEEARNDYLENGGAPRSTKVQNSDWDGSVSQVEDYLSNNLKDPDSYESIEWFKVVEKSDGYYVKHKYRAKNSFGGYVINCQLFHLNRRGQVVEVIDVQ